MAARNYVIFVVVGSHGRSSDETPPTTEGIQVRNPRRMPTLASWLFLPERPLPGLPDALNAIPIFKTRNHFYVVKTNSLTVFKA